MKLCWSGKNIEKKLSVACNVMFWIIFSESKDVNIQNLQNPNFLNCLTSTTKIGIVYISNKEYNVRAAIFGTKNEVTIQYQSVRRPFHSCRPDDFFCWNDLLLHKHVTFSYDIKSVYKNRRKHVQSPTNSWKLNQRHDKKWTRCAIIYWA